MPKEYASSRTIRRSGTKSRRLCVTCDGRVLLWKWAEHVKHHARKAARREA
jgi:hypothetical protein